LGAEKDADGYVAAVGRKTLVAAVARIYEPGCKFDHVLVLEGRQGLGKSGVCAVLGGEWFSDFKMNVGDKDTIQMMQGKWLVEMPDLHATRQADIDMVKSFLTRQIDEARMAYGRLPGRYPRQGIFIGTYNPGPDGTYLKDDENRRWWPVMCHAVVGRVFDFAGLKAVRDQLWAEAVELYKKGEPLKMETVELQDAAKAAQAERVADHPWAERVADWIRERDKNEETREDFYTGREIYIGAMGGLDVRYSRHEQISAAKALKDLGWESGARRRDGVLVRGFWRKGAKKFTRDGGDEKTDKKIPLDIFGSLL
jgi:predicted P-loop ATPase